MPNHEIILWGTQQKRATKTLALATGYGDAVAKYDDEVAKRPRGIVMLCQGAKILRQSKVG